MPGIPETLAGVGLTGVGMAVVRAREAARQAPLVADPYAQWFADAAEAEFLGPSAPDRAAGSWERMMDLVERFQDGRIVATRYFDGYVLDAVDAGCAQVVNLGAGLDTRALRLPLPGHVTCFELDQPAMFAFKEPVLARVTEDQVSAARRVVVRSDLRGRWFDDLTAAGFDPVRPTAWVEEGVLAYLLPEQATAVLDTITAVTPAGGRLAKTAIAPPHGDDETYRRLRTFVGDQDAPSAGVTGVDRANTHGLAERGWRLTVIRHADLAAGLGRPSGDPDSDDGYVTAVRA